MKPATTTPWVTENNPATQLAFAAVSTVLGALFSWLCRGFTVSRHDSTLAGFLLGLMLFVIGAVGLALSGRQRVTVDERARRITVEDENRFGTKTREIAFEEIARVGVGVLGKRSSGMQTWYVVLHLKSGEEYPLFAPGRGYEGASDRGVVDGWRRRIEASLA